MAKKVDKLEKAQAPKESKGEPKATRKAIAKKPTKVPASETVLAIIKRSRKGIDIAALKKKTGLKDSNIRTILYRLSKQGKIKSEGKGLYVKA
jgi:predicted Rossmann fold nucleotide-binding protein DprA/Smf involved in DNA uptake